MLFREKINRSANWIVLTILGILFISVSPAQAGNNEESIFDLMHFQEVLPLTIEANFTAIDSTRNKDITRNANLTFKDEDGLAQSWKVKLKVRGNFRRMKCEMPPLKIDFDKKDLKAAGLAPFDDLKLVTHCVSNKIEAIAFLQREYLAYKLYNDLTPFSYRVQLLKITYIDVSTGEKSKQWAFLIEDTAQLKSRNDALVKLDNDWNLPKDTFHSASLKIASVFQYMIGNGDWEIMTSRNLKYLCKDEKVIPIPYDFDFSGLVYASYAIPNPNYRVSSTKTRIFLGFPEDAQHLKSTLSYFKTKRKVLFETVNNFKALDHLSKDMIIDYLDSFFNSMDEINLGEKIAFQKVKKL